MGLRLHFRLLLISLCAGLVGCPAPADDDDGSPADDDDSAVGVGDDDDSAEPASAITAVTFASTLKGEAGDWTGDHGAVTDLHGTFQIIYWTSVEALEIACRQRIEFDAQARFGDAMGEEPCAACVGRLRITQAYVLPPGEFEDGCTDLPPEIDLAFLVATSDVTDPGDFRAMNLVPAWDLVEDGTPLGAGGLLQASEVIDRYAAAGFEVLYVASINPAGWLAEEALLADVAAHWADGLPMFVFYADGGTVGSPVLHDSTYVSTLWTVRVGAGLTTDSF